LETRNSSGLAEFCASLEDRSGMAILDTAAANQGTISFVTNYGHGLYADDVLTQLDDVFGGGNFYENQQNPRLTEDFLTRVFNFEEQSFDGALLWDALQFMAPSLLEPVIDRLFRITRPGACMLALFSAQELAKEVPTYSYRIQDAKTIALQKRGMRAPSQPFNNRSLEKLFQQFSSVKFFLTRDHLREVIVRR
jgi:hypothetical protein